MRAREKIVTNTMYNTRSASVLAREKNDGWDENLARKISVRLNQMQKYDVTISIPNSKFFAFSKAKNRN